MRVAPHRRRRWRCLSRVPFPGGKCGLQLLYPPRELHRQLSLFPELILELLDTRRQLFDLVCQGVNVELLTAPDILFDLGQMLEQILDHLHRGVGALIVDFVELMTCQHSEKRVTRAVQNRSNEVRVGGKRGGRMT